MTPLTLAALAALAFVLAGALTVTRGPLSAGLRTVVLSVSAGLLLAVGVGELLPEALELDRTWALGAFGAGFIVLFVLDEVVGAHFHHAEQGAGHRLVPFAVGMGVHNLVDGVAIATGEFVRTGVAVAIGVGILLHQIPVGGSVAGIFTVEGLKPRQTVRAVAGLGAAIVVAAVAVTVLGNPHGGLRAGLFGYAAGHLVYLAAGHLLPQAQTEGTTGAAWGFVVAFGGLLAATLVLER